MRSAVATLIALVSTLSLDAQYYHWSRTVGVSGNYTSAVHTAVDDAGNVYTLGTFNDTIDLDPTAGVHTVISTGLRDVFLQRINADGTYGWGCTWGVSVQQDEPHDLALDAGGRLVVMGMSSYGFTVTLGGNSYAYTAATGYGLYLIRFDPSGQVLDGAAIPGGNAVGTRRFGVAPNGDYVVGGSFRGTQDFDPGPDTANATSLIPSSDDFYLLRLSDSFAFQWVKNSFHSIGFNEFDFDSQGNIVIAGNFVTSPDFDPGPGSTVYQTPGPLVSAGYAAKYTPLGDFIWAKGWYWAQGSNACGGLAFDDDDNVYAVGSFSGIMDFDGSGPNLPSLTADGTGAGYILKFLAASGTLTWVKEVGQGTPPLYGSCNSIERNGSATFLVSGGVKGSSVDIDPGTGAYPVSTTMPYGASLIMEIDTAANLQTIHLFEGSGYAAFNDFRLNATGEIAGVGLLSPSAVDMDPGAPVDSLYAPPGNFWNAFIVKFGSSPLSLPNTQEDQQGNVFPNPGGNSFTIQDLGPLDHILQLVDGRGREVLHTRVKGQRALIDCSTLAPGPYAYRLLDRDGMATFSGRWIKAAP